MRRMTTAPIPGAPVRIDTDSVPAYAATNVAQTLFREIHKVMDDPAVQADFLRWKKERATVNG